MYKALNTKQADSSELESELAYKALGMAVRSGQLEDLVFAGKLKDAFFATLSWVAINSYRDTHFVNWKRGTKKSGPFDRYLVQYFIGDELLDRMLGGNQKPALTNDPKIKKLSEGGLHCIVQDKKHYSYHDIRNYVFLKVGDCTDLEIFQSLGYARDLLPRPICGSIFK